ncbi:hypothetical protein Corgl_0396 [Coriobacterium glomerans PW2]|uniref:Uncharacterized protein n=1 Tax=Coriobacterium glomerans (strain ATCC 49209 / DSM 20642 / JCM 10262 / PW2) TaxID=700015 RepID=F2NAI7_CORGP|nr:hypothetical protein [Coriobacterium glomerans]AEB06514.1 hypothetical protein Corgl_0396 [Coriobacterium glomerans PW2]
MRSLIVMELDKALRNRWFIVAVSIGVILGAAAAIECAAKIAIWDAAKLEFGYGIGLDSPNALFLTSRGSYGNWVLVNASDALSGLIYVYLLPLLALVPFAWSYASELHAGYLIQVCTRADRRSYLAAKGAAVFVSAALVALIPLAVNFIVLSCLLPGYVPTYLDNQYVGLFDNNLLSGLFYRAPMLFVVCRSLIDALVCGVWATLVYAISLRVANRVAIMVVPYLVVLASRYANSWVFGWFHTIGPEINIIAALKDASNAPLDPLWFSACLVAMAAVAAGLLAAETRRDLL